MTLHGVVDGAASSPAEESGTVVMWPCEECGAQFTRRSKLERHRLTHGAPMPRIVVITPSGLRLTAQQVTLRGSNDLSVSAVSPESSDTNSLTYISSVDD